MSPQTRILIYFFFFFGFRTFCQEIPDINPLTESQLVFKISGSVYWHDESRFYEKSSSPPVTSVSGGENPSDRFGNTSANGHGTKGFGVEVDYYKLKSKHTFFSYGLAYNFFTSFYNFNHSYTYGHSTSNGSPPSPTWLHEVGVGSGEVINHLLKFNWGFHYERNFVNFFIQPLNPEFRLVVDRRSQVTYETLEMGPRQVYSQYAGSDSIYGVVDTRTGSGNFSTTYGLALPTTLGIEATVPLKDSFLKIGAAIAVSIAGMYVAPRVILGYAIKQRSTSK